MIDPDKLKKILRIEMHAQSADYHECGGTECKRYKYELEFKDYQTFRFLRKKLQRIQDEEEIDLQIVGVEPVIHVSDAAVEARIEVTVREEFDRYEEENHQLEEFEKA